MVFFCEKARFFFCEKATIKIIFMGVLGEGWWSFWMPGKQQSPHVFEC